MKFGFIGLCWLVALSAASVSRAQLNQSVLAFGAGNHPGATQETWLNVLEWSPQAFFWAGSFSPGSPVSGSDLHYLLQKQSHNKHYKRFADSIPVSGVWYWTTPPLAPIDSLDAWHQTFYGFMKGKQSPWPGASYWAEWMVFGQDSIQCIFLDTWRYARPAEPENDLLGKDQWLWLQHQLGQKHPHLRLIFTAKSFYWEQKKGDSWHSFPMARQRFSGMLEKCPGPLLLVSGSHPCAAVGGGKLGERSVYELQTNGLNQVRWRILRTPEKAALAGPFCQRNFGLLTVSWNHPVSVKYQIIDVAGLEVESWTAFLEDL